LGGTLELGLAAQPMVLNAGYGGTDLQAGKLVLDYTGPADDPASAVLSILAASYNGGTNSFLSGRIFSSTATSSKGLGWIDDPTAKQVTIMPALYGDANLDGTVNVSDLSKVLTNYDQTGMDWGQGDFSYDGTVDISDLSKVLTSYDQSLAASRPTLAAVPEPSGLVLSVALIAGIACRRWTVRKGS